MKEGAMRHSVAAIALVGAVVSTPLLAQAQRQAQQGAAKTTSTSDYDRVRCRRDLVRGSLTQTRRICMTLREWDRLAVQARDTMYEDIRQRNGVMRGGGM